MTRSWTAPIASVALLFVLASCGSAARTISYESRGLTLIEVAASQRDLDGEDVAVIGYLCVDVASIYVALSAECFQDLSQQILLALRPASDRQFHDIVGVEEGTPVEVRGQFSFPEDPRAIAFEKGHLKGAFIQLGAVDLKRLATN